MADDLLKAPTELNDIPKKEPEKSKSKLDVAEDNDFLKLLEETKQQVLEIPYSEYKDKALDVVSSTRPARAFSFLTDWFGKEEPKVDIVPNTAHAIIDAAREAVKQSALNNLNTKIPTPSSNGTGMKPVENVFADKDPQTYQSMLPNAKVSPQIAQKGQAMPNNMSKLSNYGLLRARLDKILLD